MNIFRRVSLLLFVAMLALRVAAEEGPLTQESSQQDLCTTKNLNHDGQECAALIKRSQLSTVKVSPQIRSESYKSQDHFNNVNLAPLIGGTGQVR